jgi:outer membrane receptor protein involved in Fe transport
MQLKRHFRFVAVTCITLLVATLSLIAAEYRGQVKFSGLPLPGAQVTAAQGDKKLTAVSDEQGNFAFPDLPDGTWQLQVDMLGFTPAKQEVTQGSGLPGPSFELKMLPLDEIKAETAPAAPAPAVSTTAPTQTTTATPTEAPTPSLNASIAAANAAAAAAAKAAPKKGAKGATAATGATAFQRTDLSGSATPPPPATGAAAPEVTGELQTRAADSFLINGSAQNGASSPFAQNPAFGNNRKGGPRFYTYSLTLNESNNALNAEQFSQIGHSAKLPANQLTGGFNFGGPIYIPHLIEKRNNVQFTVNYARTESRNETFNPVLMPTAAERAGDFSQVLAPGGQPVQLPFANNMIPASQISLQALSLLQYYPLPNFFGSSAYNYQIPLIANTHTDQIRATASKNFKRRNFISGLYAAQDTRSDQNTNFNFLDSRRSLGMIASATYRRTYTPRFYGTFTYQFSRQSVQSLPYFSNLTNVSGNAGITGNDQTPLNYGPPSLNFQQSAITGLSDANATITHNQTSQYTYLGTWNHGRHNISFGGDFRWQQFNTIGQSNPRGNFLFTGAATGFDFADFLTGTPDQSSIAFGNADKYLRAVQPDLAFNDDWKVSPGLSLSLGLRWEYTSPITEKYGRLVNLDVAPGYAAVAPVLASAPVGPLTNMTYPASLVRPYKKEFEPRPAFAWRPFPASSMVVRGGYGIAYNTQVYQPFANIMDQESPLSKSLQLSNSTTPLTLANGFNAPANINQDSIAVNPNFRPGMVQNWTLSVQRDLPGSLVMQVTYLGIKGTHLLQAFVPNTYPGTSCPTCNYTYYTSGGNQEREAGILNLRRRLHNGFTASLTYTYSKSTDDVSGSLAGGLGQPAQNWLNLEGERGPSSTDQRHVADITLQYTSGMGMGGGTLLSGWRGKLIKDWTFLDSIHLGTGLPLTPTVGGVLGSVSAPDLRASYTGESIYAAPAGKYLNPFAVSAPAAGEWGNAGIGSIVGPSQFSMNASMQRSFRLNDRFTLSLQINANNALNHVVFGTWGTIATSSQFGVAANPNTMRNVTTVMRLTF